MNLRHDYIGIFLPWRLLWWKRPTPPYLPWLIWHGHGGFALDINALPRDLMAKKLDWLEAELKILLWVWLLTSFWHETLKILNELPTCICSQISIKHWRQKLSQRPCAQRSGCRRVWWGRTGCRYSFLRFWIYLAFSVFINSLCGFIYCLCLFTTFP